VYDAEQEYRKAFEIKEKALGREHLEVAEVLNLLGTLYQARGTMKEAESAYSRSLDIREKAFGKYHPDIADSYDTLADFFMAVNNYQEAELRYKTALEIREKIYDKSAPQIAESMQHLGVLYRQTGRYEASGHYLEKAYTSRLGLLGEKHPKVAESAKELAMLYALQGRHAESNRFFNQQMQIEGIKRDNVFLLLSEREKLHYMNETERAMHEYLSHSSTYLTTDTQALAGTLNAWLRWKGAVMEAQGRHLEAVVASGNEQLKKLFEDLTSARREIAKLQTSKWTDTTVAEIKDTLQAREKLKESLEIQLSGMSRDFAVEKAADKIDAAKIATILSANSVYLDFARIAFFDFQKKTWNPPRYLVFILSPGEKSAVTLIDLGPAEVVDRHIGAYLKVMNVSRSGYVPNRNSLDKEAAEIYKLVMRPIEPHLAGKQHLYISPDGNLNLLPFEILQDARGIYPIASFRISYITAGKDIARFEEKGVWQGKGMNAIILADPDYDFGLGGPGMPAVSITGSGKSDYKTPPKVYELTPFSRLPDTKTEANEIQKILTQKMRIPVKNYQGAHAVESVLNTADSPKILHLATHGYFLGKEEAQQNAAAVDTTQMLLNDNPMLRSGIALAGINLSLREGKDNGIMSAEKVMGLRLLGTDLVVLSACETGVGEVQNGEGVFGLKRAFILSGARAVILSLWSVPSRETMTLMNRFYTLMAEGKSKAEALRQAKMEMMEKKPNPFYWGAFILVGKPE
jgi:CHAT domain-containing protein/tetratricopeptide (TPR) repeat protein